MRYTFDDYNAAAEAIAARLGGFVPEIAMILGSGLGSMADLAENPVVIPFREIPGFPVSTAPGHKGQLVFGTLMGKPVAVMQGRLHAYEGYTFEEVCFPLRVLRLLGCGTLLITNAAGGVNLKYRVGDICLITDHIKFFPDTPLLGRNISQFGVRFPDATHLYTPRLQEIARTVAVEQGLDLQEGVYVYFPGPSYETPAEIRAIRILGGDLVGMSTVPEVLAASHAGMDVLGFSLVSNAAAGITGEPLTQQEVLDASNAAKDRFSRLVSGCVEKISCDESLCRLEVLNESHISDAIRLFTDSTVREYMGGPITEDYAQRHLSEWISSRYPSFAVLRVSDSAFLGIISVFPHQLSDQLELSYMFLPEFWGRGYAAESLALALDRCRDEWDIHALISETPSRNLRSCHLLEQLGYTLDRQEEKYGETQNIYIKRM